MYPPNDRFRRDFGGHSPASRWHVGDRVLAPWEPQFLYAGTLREVRNDEAHVAFDDGDSGWVPLAELQELHVTVDQFVLCRKEMGQLFYPATIEDVSGETVHVRFEDGDVEWTTVAAVRVIRESDGPGASPTRFTSGRAFLGRLGRGSRVLAPWENFFLYPATVLQVRDDEVHVQFDDGDAGWVNVGQVHPLELRAGLLVSVRGSDLTYQPGEILAVEGDRVRVQLESGTTREVRLRDVRVPCMPAGDNARPTHVVAGGARSGSAWGWLVGVLIVVALMVVVNVLARML